VAGGPGRAGGPDDFPRPDEFAGPGGPGGPGGPDDARARLVDELRDSGRLTSPALEAAFRAVPRHVFLPGMAASQAYQDEAFVIKTGEDGLPLSSSSQPAIMAIMLEQLGVGPGHRVLEIGTGTGYNAALMSYLVGPEGSVVTVDIDPDLVDRARANLAAAGYTDVTLLCGDGSFGAPDYAPYDRIIVTAGASDLAPEWLAQLGPHGRIALPLSVRGIQLCIALVRDAGHWVNRAACRCGFIRMAGSLASPEPYDPVGPQPGLHVQTDDGQPLPADALYQALTGPVADVPTGVLISGLGELGEADLWVTFAEPGLARLTITGGGPLRGGVLPMLPFGALADSGPDPGVGAGAGFGAGAGAGAGAGSGAGGFGIAGLILATPPASPGEHRYGEFEVAVRGFGPGGAALALRLAGQVGAWQAAGRPRASDLRVTAYPRTTARESTPAREPAAPASEPAAPASEPAAPASEPAAPASEPAAPASEPAAPLAHPGQLVVDRPHTRLVLSWPAALDH
jgi:protein-L-isoaspartate(D-aspartate) O-methyltransferase